MVGRWLKKVLRSIRESDAMIGFTTRRDAAGADQSGRPQFTTHPWVIQELNAAMTQNPPIPFVEVWEEGVIEPGGMISAANTQRIFYRESERAACLIEIAEALVRFRGQSGVTTVRLGPKEVVDHLRPLLDDPSCVCRWQRLRNAAESPQQEARVLRVKGSLVVNLRGVLPGDYVRLLVSAGGRTWHSDYESVDTVDIRLEG